MTNPQFYYVTIIDAPTERVWQALTTAEFTRQYWHETEVQSDWKEGSSVKFFVGEDKVGCEGKVLSSLPFSELSYTWHFSANPACASEAPSRVTFTLEDLGGATKLTICHDSFESGTSPTYQMVSEGWPFVLSGLKTLLECGKTRNYSALHD